MDWLEKEIKFGYSKDRIFYYLHNRKPIPTYENELFLEKFLNSTFKMKEYKVMDCERVEEQAKKGTLFFLNKDAKEVSFRDLHDWSDREALSFLSLLYDRLSAHNAISTNYPLKGKFKTTKVLIYIKEKNLVILPPTYNAEDILNVLTIPGISVFVLHRDWFNKRRLFMAIQISTTSVFHKEINKEINKRKEEEERVKEWIQKIVPRKEKKEYLSLEDKNSCYSFYQTLSEQQKRDTTRFFLDLRGEKIIKNLYGSLDTLFYLGEKIQPIEALIQSFTILEKYKKDNQSLIEKDKERDKYKIDWMSAIKYKIQFAPYKIILKEVGTRFRKAKQWIEEFHEIVEKQVPSSPNKEPNKESIYYEATMKAVRELEKLWFISEVILFGSVARGEEKYQSDIDLFYKIGFDVSKLTPTRRNQLHSIVTQQLEKVQREYEEKIDGFPLPSKYSFQQKRLIEILSWDLQKKSERNAMLKAGFLDNSITLLKRESFHFHLHEIKETIPYKDIDIVMIPTNRHYSYISKIISENEEFVYLKQYKYEFNNNDSSEFRYKESFIGIHRIEKKSYFQRELRVASIRNLEEINDFINMNEEEKESWFWRKNWNSSDYELEMVQKELLGETWSGRLRKVQDSI